MVRKITLFYLSPSQTFIHKWRESSCRDGFFSIRRKSPVPAVGLLTGPDVEQPCWRTKRRYRYTPNRRLKWTVHVKIGRPVVSGVTSHRQPRQCRGWPGAQNGKGGPKWPELCIKTVIRLCTGISQNHHPRLLTLPFRTGRYLLFRNVCRGGAKIIVTPLGIVTP